MDCSFLQNYLLWDEFLIEFIIYNDKIIYFNFTESYLNNLECYDRLDYKILGTFERNISVALWDGTYDYLYTDLGVIYTGN